MKRIFAYAFIWIVLAACIGALLGSLNLPKLRLLASHGIKAQGAVLSLEPTNHRIIHYSYRVNEVNYSDYGQDGYGNPDFDALSAGDPILVYYLSFAPETSVLGNPAERLRNEIASIIPPLLIVPTILVAIISAKRRRSRPVA